MADPPTPPRAGTGQVPPMLASRALLPDARRGERFLRVTWHPDARQFVVSTWDGERCVGAVRLVADAAGELVALLVRGMTEAAAGPAGPGVPVRPALPDTGA